MGLWNKTTQVKQNYQRPSLQRSDIGQKTERPRTPYPSQPPYSGRASQNSKFFGQNFGSRGRQNNIRGARSSTQSYRDHAATRYDEYLQDLENMTRKLNYNWSRDDGQQTALKF